MKNENFLRRAVENMQSLGAVNIRVVEYPGKVMLIGDLPPAGRLSHILRNIRNVGTRDEQKMRLERWVAQYRHWLDWVFINQGNNEIGEHAK